MLLWYFEEPARYRAEARRSDAPLLDPEVVLKLALGRRVGFGAPALNGAQTVAMLRDAAALYVRLLFFRPEATPYQTLGLAPGASPEAIKESFRLLMQLVHPDRQDARAVWPDSFAALANRAYGVLRDQDARARFDREAEARAAMARAIHRAAAASAASQMPTVQRPRPQFGGGRLLRRMKLPEWLTAGVGGYAREHPSTIAYSVLVGVAVLAIGTLGWEGKEGWLTREIREDPAQAAPRVLAVTPAPATPVAFVAGKREPAASPNGGTVPKRSVQPESTPAIVVAAPATPDGDVPLASPLILADSRPPAPAAPAPAVLPVTDAHASKGSAPNFPSENSGSAARATTVAAPAPVPQVPKAESGPGSALPSPGTGAGIVSAPAVLANQRAAASPPVAVASPPAAVATPPAAVATPTVAVATPPVAVAVPPVALAPPARAEQAAMVVASSASSSPPISTEIESLFATFVEAYERGRLDTFAALFDDDADTNLRHGRAAIRGEYDELFRLSQWRKMQLTRVNWKRVGDRAVAKGEITVRIGWRDGREVEQRLLLDMELVRRDGRVMIARLSQQAKN